MGKSKKQDREKGAAVTEQAVEASSNQKLQDASKLHQQGQLSDAVMIYREVLADDPKNLQVLFNLGLALMARGEADKAMNCFQEALKINPDDEKLHYHLGRALYRKRRIREAVESFKSAIKVKPDFADAYSALSNALRTLRSFKAAGLILCFL
jgi:tetratricopeptide (TPR) repeat protein